VGHEEESRIQQRAAQHRLGPRRRLGKFAEFARPDNKKPGGPRDVGKIFARAVDLCGEKR
jgi:hypothetical protein